MATKKNKPQSKTSAPIGAIFVSDLHIGSDVALWPDNFKTHNGNVVSIGDNPVQRWLWECWNDAVTRAVEHFGNDPFVVIVNGDIIEGNHHSTWELMTPREKDMAKAAIQILKPLTKKAQSTHFVEGTFCHVKEWEPYVATQLEAKCHGDKMMMEIHGTLIDVAHHMPTTGRAYLEASALSILMGNARLNKARSGHRIPRLYARGHRHVGGFYSDLRAAIIVTPAWQLLTKYGHKVVGDSISSPGIVVADWRGHPLDSVPTIKSFNYEIDEPEIIKA